MFSTLDGHAHLLQNGDGLQSLPDPLPIQCRSNSGLVCICLSNIGVLGREGGSQGEATALVIRPGGREITFQIPSCDQKNPLRDVLAFSP